MRGLEALRQVGGRSSRRSSTVPKGTPPSSLSASPSGFEGECRRAYFRVETRLPLRLTWLTNDRAQALAHAIEASGSENDVSGGEEALRFILRRIEEKLDLLLTGQTDAALTPLCYAEPTRVVISGAGLETTTDEPFRTGDPVKVELLLPGSRPRTVTALARVVYGPPRRVRGARGEVALAFENIPQSDRDALVRHVYDVQRITLRGRARVEARP